MLMTQHSDAPAAASPRLAEVPVAFCDSVGALEQAYAAGLSRRARIVTFSPALAWSGRPGVSVATPQAGHGAMLAFHDTVRDFVRDLHVRSLRAGLGEAVALHVAREALSFQSRICLAAHLRPEDGVEPRAFLASTTGHPALDRQTRPIWQDLLGDRPSALFLSFRVEPTAERHADGGAVASFRDRLRLAGWERIAYRALLELWRRAPFLPNRGTVGILHESELVKEAACHLGLRGYRLAALRRPEIDAAPLPEDLASRLGDILDAPMGARIAALVPADIVTPLLALFHRQLHPVLAAYAHGLDPWRRTLDRHLPAGKPACLLTNYPASGDMSRLAELCGERQSPFAAFQHGLSREIQATHAPLEANFENNLADTFFAFNEAAASVSAANPFARKGGHVLAVGLPRDYSRAAAPRRRGMVDAPILFVSTALYRGHYQRVFYPLSDVELAAEEIQLVDEVLGRLPHRVHYKPYPALRYPDPDPVLARVRTAPNMQIVGADTDLRHIVSRYRILVCTRATNTIAWCLMARRPFVFIDPPGFYRLRDEVRDDFRAATFYIDAARPEWRQELHTLLSRPVEALERDWHDRLPALEALIRSTVSVAPRGAGRRAADALEALMHEIDPPRSATSAATYRNGPSEERAHPHG